MKEQTRNTKVQINEEKISKLPEKEFRIMIVKMITNLENKMEKMQESVNKDLEELKNKHTETNNTITEIKNTPEGTNSRISEAEEQTSELENKMVEITSEEQNKVKRMKRTEDSLRDLSDNTKCINICCKAGLVVLNSLNFCLSEKILISEPVLNEILSRYSNLGVDCSL